jgi:hypothetical protein
MTKLVVHRPGCTDLCRLVMTPFSSSGSSPSLNISVCTARSRLLPRRASTASGMHPMPICSVEPSSIRSAITSPIWFSTAPHSFTPCSCSARSVCVNAVTRFIGTTVLPSVRGMRALTSASTTPAQSAAARAASTLVPSVHSPWLSGRRELQDRRVEPDRPAGEQPGNVRQEHGHRFRAPFLDGLARRCAHEQRHAGDAPRAMGRDERCRGPPCEGGTAARPQGRCVPRVPPAAAWAWPPRRGQTRSCRCGSAIQLPVHSRASRSSSIRRRSPCRRPRVTVPARTGVGRTPRGKNPGKPQSALARSSTYRHHGISPWNQDIGACIAYRHGPPPNTLSSASMSSVSGNSPSLL